jgi:hypothetical protein
MNDPSASAVPFWFPIFAIGLWLFMCAFFSLISGWASLARHFRAVSKPEGEKVTGQVKWMGIVPENLVTHMIVSGSGLYLYAGILFRFLHPALLIPWKEVRLVGETKMLVSRTYELDLASITSLRITRTGYEAVQRYVTPETGGE